MKFKTIKDLVAECSVVAYVFKSAQDANIEYPVAVSFHGKRGHLESFDPEQREMKFKSGHDVYFLSEAELQDWCIDKTYWMNGCLYRSGNFIYKAEIEEEERQSDGSNN